MQRVVLALAISSSFIACAEFEKGMKDLSKPIKGPSINAPSNASVNVGTNGATGAQPTATDGGAAATGTGAGGQPPAGQPANVITGTCEGSCNHYLACKNVSDANYKAECIKGCVALTRHDRC